jgi:hypothetical protein
MSARDELYAYGTAAFETGVPPVIHEHLTKLLNAYKAEVLREGADIVAELRDTTDVNVAEYPRYDFRQRVALDHAETRIRRLASKTEAGTPTP